MVLPPRTLAWRLAFWSLLFAWAVWKINGKEASEALTSAPLLDAPAPAAWEELPRPADGSSPAVATQGGLDAAGLLAAMAGLGAACPGAVGELELRTGPEGLAAVRVRGVTDEAARTCLAKAAWALSAAPSPSPGSYTVPIGG